MFSRHFDVRILGHAYKVEDRGWDEITSKVGTIFHRLGYKPTSRKTQTRVTYRSGGMIVGTITMAEGMGDYNLTYFDNVPMRDVLTAVLGVSAGDGLARIDVECTGSGHEGREDLTAYVSGRDGGAITAISEALHAYYDTPSKPRISLTPSVIFESRDDVDGGENSFG